MEIRDLIQALGGPGPLGAEIGAAPKAVSMWGTRNEIPAAFHISVWRVAKRLGVNWTPDGASGLDLVESVG